MWRGARCLAKTPSVAGRLRDRKTQPPSRAAIEGFPFSSSVTLARMTPRIIPIAATAAGEVSTPAPDRLIEGSPEQKVSNAFTDSTGQFFAGRWSSTRGKWRVRYTENELCVMMAGRVVLTGDDGTGYSFGAGDAFVIPAGFSGTWEVVVDCTKIYAVFEKLT